MLLTGCQKPAIIGVPARGYCMKTKGSTSYTGVTLGELKKYFTDDAVIEVSKKFLNAHKMIAGSCIVKRSEFISHVALIAEKEQELPQIQTKHTDLEDNTPAKIEQPVIVSKLDDFM